MALKLMTYASDGFFEQAEGLKASALAAGFDDAVVFSPAHLQGTDFYRDNADILSQKRGAGYWLWKPYLIKQCLLSANENDVLLYCDAGRNNYYGFTMRPERLIARCRSGPQGVLLGPAIPHLGAVSAWTKRDCLIQLEADNKEILDRPLMATWSLWRRTDFALGFVGKWLEACRDARCLTDLPNVLGKPNYPEFKDHRHDQSVLSILAYQERVDFLDFSETLVQRLMNLRPNSLLSHMFYKRPENAERILGGAGVGYLMGQYRAMKSCASSR